MTNGELAGERPSMLSAQQLIMLAHALDAVPSAIAFWDSDLRNVFANRAYRAWLGVTPEQARGQHAKDLFDPEAYLLSEPYMQAALEGERQVFERVSYTPSGEEREAQVEYTPYSVDGEVVGFVAIVTDVSVRISAERAARAAAERLAVLTERQRIEQRAHEGILQDLFAVQLNIERARAEAAGHPPTTDALDLALDRLDAAVADLRLVLGVGSTSRSDGGGGAPARPPAAIRG